MVFRFHVLSLPHTVTDPEYSACAYTMKVLKFCKMMKEKGHYIIHYGHKDSIVDCDEKVDLLDNDDLVEAYGEYDWRKHFFKHNCQDHCHKKFNKDGITEIMKRIQKADFVLPFWGKGHLPIVNAVNVDGRGVVVEPGIGYHDSWCKYRIYESYCVMHHTMGLQGSYKPSYYHAVIPNYFNTEDFEFSNDKQDYFLFLGRIAYCKGVHVAIQICEKIGAKLIIAGQGDLKDVGYTETPDFVTLAGYAGPEKRKELMKNAKGFFLISDYAEPFGGSAVEAMMSGTPVIVPDYGVFPETVLHGITGYRCRTFEQYCWAAKNIENIKPVNCRDWAVNNYSLDKVSEMYTEFFTQIDNVQRKGWYEEVERENLNWLYKEYPPTQKVTETVTKEVTKEVTDNVTKEVTKEVKPKIAIWSENNWAFGRIYNSLIENMDDYSFTWYDWRNVETNKKLFQEEWKKFDLIIGNSCLLYSPITLGFISEIPEEMSRKFIVTYHCPEFDRSHYTEKFIKNDNVMYTGVSQEITEKLKGLVNHVAYTPTGADPKRFPKIFNIEGNIKTIGIVSGGVKEITNDVDRDVEDTKRPRMAKSIIEKAGKQIKYIHSRPLSDYGQIYEDIDLLICTSTFEGGPLGVFEAVLSGVPVISTNVGRVKELKNIGTFETEEEAIQLIKSLDSQEVLQNYFNDLYLEIFSENNFKFWDSAFKFRMNLNDAVDIIMPVYNTNLSWVKESVDSCFNQTYTGHIRLIIYNDGSERDYTKKLIELLQEYSQDIILLDSKENKGISTALNKCLESSTAEYIFRMDSDDTNLPTRIETQLRHFKTLGKDVAVLGSNLQRMNNTFTTNHPREVTIENLLTKSFWKVNHPTVCFRGDIIRKIGYPDVPKRYPEDVFLWYNLLKNNYKIINIPEVLLKYRSHENNASSNLIQVKKEDIIKFFN